ncbi:c-type cytochrome [Achromobacter pulmonis]|uniref:Thiosulfate dehydrogenase n=1 Tax=Achromobacter pulmonis TaxID=1389932 RepID=A0A6S7CBW5_9BURK|nr:c-type cytochrome [Achromobacter pulmonis]MCF7768283.1 c-type cytochrome [Achromobacter pulmonis]CAB3639884.1 Thiosulfate dehydrogenase [Achromobacter pulmonis]CAB3842114.1 Thiosulfate dehydrogenase [Achromobacter pulmonis]
MNNLHKIAAALALVAAGGTAALAATPAPADTQTFAVLDKDGKRLPDYTIPSDTLIDSAPNAEQIRYGQRLLNETRRLLPHNTGASLNCSSCHVQQGKKPLGAPYINSFNSFPQFNPRAGRDVTLADRINGCFQRSMNGKPLDKDSPEMAAMLAYMKWLAQDVPHGAKVQIKNAWPIDTKLVPDPARGKHLYAAQCASCHGAAGEGKRDRAGNIVFPPLWGDESFNIGAGLARTYKAAAFIRNSMPMGVNTHGNWGEGKVLSDQDAVDVAEYFTHMPRPDFPPKDKDWPDGKKPKDARY